MNRLLQEQIAPEIAQAIIAQAAVRGLSVNDFLRNLLGLASEASAEPAVADARQPQQLVREDQKRKAQERLEELLLEGLNSGESTPMTEQDWEEIRAEVRQR